MSDLDILVILGTDHHHFDRLVNWVDDLLDGDDRLSAVVQLGYTGPPRRARGLPGIMPYEELQRLTQAAKVIVTHGGPATMWEVRRLGRRPLVVPRDPTFGEHVDDHQILFARRMAALGLVTLCADQATFHERVMEGLRSPVGDRVSAEELDAEQIRVEQARIRTGHIIDTLATTKRRRGRRRT